MGPKAKLFWLVNQRMQNQQGLSLLEIVIAMAVVFLALLGFAGFSVVAHTGMSASEKMTRAVTLAQETMEDIQREGVPPGLTTQWTNTEPYGSIAGALHHQRILTITPDDPMPGLHTVTIQVQWDNGAHATSLKTYVTQE
jgi:type II secretory pathway pseudopilin PulG